MKHLKEELKGMKVSDGNDKVAQNFVSAASKHIVCQNMISFISKSIFIDEELKN